MAKEFESSATTSRRQIIRSNTSYSSRKKITKQIIDRDKRIIITNPRTGKPMKVDVAKGDVVTIVTKPDGTTQTSIEHKDTTRNYSVSSQKSQSSSGNSSSITKFKQTRAQSGVQPKHQYNYVSKPASKTRRSVRQATNPYNIPKNDLSFINQYIEAYKNREQDPKRLEAFNVALSKNPNKNVVWKGIWIGIDPTHTQKVSDAQHEMLYTIHPGTRNEMGQMNWYNIFNGNLLHATSDDLSIPRSSLDYISPQQRTKTIQLTNPSYSESSTNISDNSNNVEDIIKNNLDLFRQQYEYAKQNNGAFDYSPSSFNAEKLNVKQKYGGIGDFMDTYGLSPGYLLSVLDKTFNPKYQQGGSVRKAQSKERTDAIDLYSYFFGL